MFANFCQIFLKTPSFFHFRQHLHWQDEAAPTPYEGSLTPASLRGLTDPLFPGRYSDIRKHIEVHHGLVFSPDTYVYQLEHLDEAGLSIGSSGEVVNVRTFECGLCKRK